MPNWGLQVSDGIRAGVAADRSQLFKDLTTPFYGANRPGAKVSAKASAIGRPFPRDFIRAGFRMRHLPNDYNQR